MTFPVTFLRLGTVGLLLSLALVSCSQPTQPSDAQLKEKVLQIIRDNPEVILDAVREYQQRRSEEQRKTQRNFIQQMQTNPGAVIGSSPTLGSPDRKVVLLIFSDFQCPYCAKAHAPLKDFMKERQGQVTLVYKHLPLVSIHPEAMPAAKASWAAQQQGKFWEYYDALFENQDKLGESFYVETAKALNLDLKKFDDDRKSEAANQSIQQDVKMAEDLGVQGTPFIVINGVPVEGPVSVAELNKVLAQVGSGAANK